MFFANILLFGSSLFPNLSIQLIAVGQGGFTVSYVLEIVVRKNLTNFEGCHFPQLYIVDLIEFSENRDK